MAGLDVNQKNKAEKSVLYNLWLFIPQILEPQESYIANHDLISLLLFNERLSQCLLHG